VTKIEPERFRELLTESFRKILRDVSVRTDYIGWDRRGWGDPNKATVTVVSPDFEDMGDGRRQELVWEAVYSNLGYKAHDQIEFIFTKAPSELKAAQAV
jgi:hypothetical protein